jgi:hypothetical protein
MYFSSTTAAFELYLCQHNNQALRGCYHVHPLHKMYASCSQLAIYTMLLYTAESIHPLAAAAGVVLSLGATAWQRQLLLAELARADPTLQPPFNINNAPTCCCCCCCLCSLQV